MSMSFIRRALTGVAATALLAGAIVTGTAAPAAADSSACPEASSTRLLTANGDDYKLWIYQPSGSEIHICYSVGWVPFSGAVQAGEVVVRTGQSGSFVPSVTPVTNDSTCPDFFNLEDPADLLIEGYLIDLSDPYSYCFGFGDNAAFRVTIDTANGSLNPSAEIWIDRDSYVLYLACDYLDLPLGYCTDYWNYQPFRVL